MKRLAITTSILIAALVISNRSSAQLGLGLSGATRLSSAAAISTPSISNALRASASATRATTSATRATTSTATRTATSTAKTTTATAPDADIKVKASASASTGAKNK